MKWSRPHGHLTAPFLCCFDHLKGRSRMSPHCSRAGWHVTSTPSQDRTGGLQITKPTLRHVARKASFTYKVFRMDFKVKDPGFIHPLHEMVTSPWPPPSPLFVLVRPLEGTIPDEPPL